MSPLFGPGGRLPSRAGAPPCASLRRAGVSLRLVISGEKEILVPRIGRLALAESPVPTIPRATGEEKLRRPSPLRPHRPGRGELLSLSTFRAKMIVPFLALEE
jgi:hypothetical protein